MKNNLKKSTPKVTVKDWKNGESKFKNKGCKPLKKSLTKLHPKNRLKDWKNGKYKGYEAPKKSLKTYFLSHTFEDWKNGTYGGVRFENHRFYRSRFNVYFELFLNGEICLIFIKVSKEAAAQILSEQKKIYHKIVEDLAQKFVTEFHRQHQMRGNGQILLNREIEELEKLFFEENLSTKGSIEVIKYFNFNTVVSFRITSEETKYADWYIDKIRGIHDKIKKNKRYRGRDKAEWYRYVKPDNNTDLEKYEMRVEALEKYRLHLIAFRDVKLSPSQALTTNSLTIPTNTEKLTKALSEYQFNELEKVKVLSPENQKNLLQNIATNKAPYQIAMLNYLGFIEHLKKEHCQHTDYRVHLKLTPILGVNKDTIKKNMLALNPKFTGNKNRYTSHLHIETVENYYNSLK